MEKTIFLPENIFLIDDWMEVDEQELVYPITRDSSKGREEKKEEKAFSSSLVVHKMASSRRENHFFSSRLSDSDLLLFTYVPGQFFSRKLLAGLLLRLLSCFFGGFGPSFDRLLQNASPFSIVFAEESFFQPFLPGKPP